MPSPSPQQRAQLDAFLAELYRWNARLNLTRVPSESAWTRHVEESLELLDAIPATPNGSLLDLGSGGGLPGIPIAIVRPEIRVTLLEAEARKTAFLTHVAGVLGLGSVEVITARAEAFGRRPDRRERYDAVVSRATATPAVLCELALPLLRLGGRLVARAAGDVTVSPAVAAAAAACGGSVPSSPAAGVFIIAKVSPTPDRYPRRDGVPARHPLA